MKNCFLLIAFLSLPPSLHAQTQEGKPTVSFTFDDGITSEQAGYAFEDWNAMILTALRETGLKAVFFVTGANKLDEKGKFLLAGWSAEGHRIANHSFTHPNFGSEKWTPEAFEHELMQTDSVISAYPTHLRLFRFPYLKEGKTREKIDAYREILHKHGYRNGSVTIDASDWFVNSELIKCIREQGKNSPCVQDFKAFYLQHLLERAAYYEKLAFALTGRHIHHTLLLHHNLSSALFLDDLIQKFKQDGWAVMDAETAFQDPVFQQEPGNVPAGESLIWALAKASGKFESELRYPAEDSEYEIPKMRALGIIK